MVARVRPGLAPGNFAVGLGPSRRFLAVLDPAGIRAFDVLPGGNNGNPGMPVGGPSSSDFNTINPEIHYGDQTPAWLNGGRYERYFDRDTVEGHVEVRWRMTGR